MTDEQTNKSDTDGKEDNTSTQNISEIDKIRKQNEEFEKELIKARELRAEAQKLEAERLLGGTTGQHIPKEKTKEEIKIEETTNEIVSAFR